MFEIDSIDEPIKSRKNATDVIPAKAGIQKYHMVTNHWTPAFAGVTTFYEVVSIDAEIKK